jgi:pimeloyl-ACP methyl ester carboxylesterase
MVTAGLVGVLVFAATHPPRISLAVPPAQFGAFYEPVTMLSGDGRRVNGTLVPVIDARRVLAERDRVLHRKDPAVILIHSMGASSEQMWPLVRPLHEAGIVVLALDLRGSSKTSTRAAAQTFGLQEWQDVEAGIQMLRRRPFVDGKRIALVGVGSGANAAMIAASRDGRIAALVLCDPVSPFDALDRFIENTNPLRSLQPLCRLTFEIAYRVNLDDLKLERHADALRTRPVLLLDALGNSGYLADRDMAQVDWFLKRHLKPQATSVGLADQ